MSLQLQSIALFQFKNYFHQAFQFQERVVGICGNNGVGKTNLLDAIHYLCFTKSYFTRDILNIQNGQTGFRVDGEIELNKKKKKQFAYFVKLVRKNFQSMIRAMKNSQNTSVITPALSLPLTIYRSLLM